MKKRHIHRNIPQGHFEEEQGQNGFFGAVSHLIKKQPSTRWNNIEGSLKPRMFDLVHKNNKSSWKPLLYNHFLTIHFLNCKNHSSEVFKSANGDLLYFCHKGKGIVLTEYGLLNYHSGQYIVIPKSFSHVFIPSEESQFFIVENLNSHYKSPDRGLLGRHGLYDESSLIRPDLDAMTDYLNTNNLEFKKMVVHHQNEKTVFSYDDCLFDVTEWKGDLFPYTLDMKDIMPIMSHRVHLPPSIHSTFVAKDFIVCSFLPRPLEQDKEALKVPFYHQNTDYDEVIFYHKGDFFSRDNLHPGMMSFHPVGFPHGPHPKAIQGIENKTSTDEYAVMIDSRWPLKRYDDLKSIELKDYWKSWS